MSIDDELLAIRCQLGEREAFDALIARWHGPLWTYARRVAGTPDAADDVVQDVWMRIVRGLPRLKEPARIRAWIFGIARRVLMDRLREKYRTPEMAEVDLGEIATEEADLGLGADLSRLHDALAKLPVLERDTLALFYLDECSLNEMSDVQAVPVGTVKSRLFRARQLLRNALTEESNT